MEKKKRSITTAGIVWLIILAAAMIWHTYNKLPDKQLFERIIEGVWLFGCSFIGAGLFLLIMFFVIYAAIKISPYIFGDQEESEKALLECFNKLSNPLLIVGFIASYIYLFFWS